MNRIIDEDVVIVSHVVSEAYRDGWERCFGEPEPASPAEQRQNERGVIVAWNQESLWASAELESGQIVNFHATCYHGNPAAWPHVGVSVDVVYNGQGKLLSVFQRMR